MAIEATKVRWWMERRDPPRGVVTKYTIKHGAIGCAHYTGVKYIARHVSATLPDGYWTEPDDPNRLALKAVFRDFNSDRQTAFFKTMLATLLDDETMVLPVELYEAAFKTKIVGRSHFDAYLETDDNYEEWVFQLLYHAGYPVNQDGPLLHNGD